MREEWAKMVNQTHALMEAQRDGDEFRWWPYEFKYVQSGGLATEFSEGKLYWLGGI